MYILKQVLDDILREIGSHPVESGGIIGCRGDLICAFRFDGTFTSQYQYRPDIGLLNDVIKGWNSNGISFCGFVHSHLYGLDEPSESDRLYAEKLFACGTGISTLLFPIVTFDSDTNQCIRWFRYDQDLKDFEEIVCLLASFQ